jgi:hypothetical protein
MTTTTATPEAAPQWAIIELMGHVRTGGLVSKDNQLGTAMLRVDVPQADGAFVTQLVNPSSIYRITFAAEELARAAARSNQAAPISQWELQQALPAPRPVETAAEDPDDCPF